MAEGRTIELLSLKCHFAYQRNEPLMCISKIEF